MTEQIAPNNGPEREGSHALGARSWVHDFSPARFAPVRVAGAAPRAQKRPPSAAPNIWMANPRQISAPADPQPHEPVSLQRVRGRAPDHLVAALDAVAIGVSLPPRQGVAPATFDRLKAAYEQVAWWASAECAGRPVDVETETAVATCLDAAGLLLVGEDGCGPWEVLIALIGHAYGAAGHVVSAEPSSVPVEPVGLTLAALDAEGATDERAWSRRRVLRSDPSSESEIAGQAVYSEDDDLSVRWLDLNQAERRDHVRAHVQKLFTERFSCHGIVWDDAWSALVSGPEIAEAECRLLHRRQAGLFAVKEVFGAPGAADRTLDVLNDAIVEATARYLAPLRSRRGRPLAVRASFVIIWELEPPVTVQDDLGRPQLFSPDELGWISLLGGNWPENLPADAGPSAILRAEREAVERARTRLLPRFDDLRRAGDLLLIGQHDEPECFVRERRASSA